MVGGVPADIFVPTTNVQGDRGAHPTIFQYEKLLHPIAISPWTYMQLSFSMKISRNSMENELQSTGTDIQGVVLEGARNFAVGFCRVDSVLLRVNT